MAKVSDRDRYKYGVCTNRDKEGKPCPKCESKEVQKIRMGQDFICEECKEPLRQVPPPKAKTPMGMIIGIIIGAIVIIGGGIVGYNFLNGKGKSVQVAQENITVAIKDTISKASDSSKIELKDVEQPKTVESQNSKKNQPQPILPKPDEGKHSATISVNGGIYKGEVTGGKPNGEGTLTYNSHTRISMKDIKERYAEAGQYIIGVFYNGELEHGTLYNTNNEPIASIRIGR